MEYKKIIVGGYILGLAEVNSGNISKDEYDRITEIIHNKPTAPKGFDYRLKDNLEWELYELPAPVPEDDEATIEDYEAALAELGVK